MRSTMIFQWALGGVGPPLCNMQLFWLGGGGLAGPNILPSTLCVVFKDCPSPSAAMPEVLVRLWDVWAAAH